MNKPEIIQQIEKIIPSIKIEAAPERPGAVLPTRYGRAMYAQDKAGNITGLNLAKVGLTDKQWKQIAALDGLAENLQLLNLNENELTVFEFLGTTAFRKLESLWLANNKIRTFALPKGKNALIDLVLEENPLAGTLGEMLPRGNDLVLDYLQGSKSGTEEIFEVKMLIVGEGGTGKTTLWNLLKNSKHKVPDPEQESTIGIQIEEGWNFPHPDHRGEQFSVNLWDFGGQDIQYMTHQFFLTRRSFYVLLADGRKEVANFSYWFKIINLLGCDENEKERLPVLVVLNERGNPNFKMPYDQATIKEDFPKLEIIRREVDFADKARGDGRFEALVKTIKETLTKKIPHLPLEFPENWFKVRQALSALRKDKNHITANDFEKICNKNDVKGKATRDRLSRLLHDLGVLLHFCDDPELANFIVLNPQWAANAVYEIMKHKTVKENHGRFDKKILFEVWEKSGFTTAEQANLIRLMLKDNFEICFKADEKGKEIYIAPQLLAAQRPEAFSWETDKATLQYMYVYPFMPKGIIGRLIVRVNEDIEEREKQKMVWEKGAILVKENCRALIVEENHPMDGRQTIKIEIQGQGTNSRKNILRDIRTELHKIHSRSFPRLKYYQKIPCICSECLQSEKPYAHDLDELENLKTKNALSSQCRESGASVPIRALLSLVGLMEMEDKPSDEEPQNKTGKKIFFSYSKNDRKYLDQLKKHLTPLKRNGKIKGWDDHDILPGEEWDEKIKTELAQADIIILMVSVESIATDYICDVEIKQAIERHEKGDAVVIPVILDFCIWKDMPFAKLNVLPLKGKPITDHDNEAKAWVSVVEGIELRIK